MIRSKLKALFSRVLAIILRRILPSNTTKMPAGVYEKPCSFCTRVIEHNHMYLDLSIFIYPGLKFVCIKCIATTLYNMDPVVWPNFLPQEHLQIEEAMAKLVDKVPKSLPEAKKEI